MSVIIIGSGGGGGNHNATAELLTMAYNAQGSMTPGEHASIVAAEVNLVTAIRGVLKAINERKPP